MPVIYLKDDNGYKIRVRDIDGSYTFAWDVLPNHEEEFKSIKTWKARPDDVMICAYPKSGTHWTHEVLSMLLNQKAERVESIKQSGMMDLLSQSQFDMLPSPRVLNTHSLFSQLPVDFKNKRCKIVHIIRNPKDVAVSFYHHHYNIKPYEYDGDWESYLPRFIEGKVDYNGWFEYTLDWERTMSENPDYPIHLIYYEDMIEDLPKEIAKLGKFLGQQSEITREFIDKVASLCSFQKMQKEKKNFGDRETWKEGSMGMYRKGIVGDWKNMFTVQQNEMFDKIYNDRMKNSKLNIRFTIQSMTGS